MKTMLLSDLIIMRRNLSQMVLTCFIIVIVITVAMNSTLAPIGGCFGAMIPLLYLFTVAGYDEMNDWQTFRLTLPSTRKGIMAGRYASLFIIALISIVIGVAVSYLVGFIVSLIGTQNGAGFGSTWNYTSPSGEFLSTLSLATNPPELIFGSAVGGAAMALFLAAITLPLVAKVGLTKSARLVPVVGVVIFLIALAAFGEGGPLTAHVPDFIQWLLTDESAVLYLIFGGAAVVVVLYILSLFIAIKLYEKREF